MARPGGNPELEKHQFVPKGEESNIYPINLKVSKSMKDKLDPLGKDKNEFIRQAIAKALEDLEELP